MRHFVTFTVFIAVEETALVVERSLVPHSVLCKAQHYSSSGGGGGELWVGAGAPRVTHLPHQTTPPTAEGTAAPTASNTTTTPLPPPLAAAAALLRHQAPASHV